MTAQTCNGRRSADRRVSDGVCRTRHAAWQTGETAADLQQIHTLLAHRVAALSIRATSAKWECAEQAADMIDDAADEISRLSNLLGEERTARQALEGQLEALQREGDARATLMSGQDRYTAAGYLMRASKRKPRTCSTKDKARDAALSSIRAGAQRA